MVEKILIEWLRANGYLPASGSDADPEAASPAKPAGKKSKA